MAPSRGPSTRIREVVIRKEHVALQGEGVALHLSFPTPQPNCQSRDLEGSRPINRGMIHVIIGGSSARAKRLAREMHASNLIPAT